MSVYLNPKQSAKFNEKLRSCF